LFLFTAKTAEALEKVKQRFLQSLSTVDHSLAEITFTLTCARISSTHRDSVVASSIAELKKQFNKSTSTSPNIHLNKSRLIFVFPRQGSEYHGMARTCAPIIDHCLGEWCHIDGECPGLARSTLSADVSSSSQWLFCNM
jgi:acyl transferase domain-containing protein